MRTGQFLVAAGYQGTSNKYRHVSKLPIGKTPLEALEEIDPGAAARLWQDLYARAAAEYRRHPRCPERLELTPEEWLDFRAAGGQSSR